MGSKYFQWIRKYWVSSLVLGVWLILLGVGFWGLLTYSNTPGESAQLISKWPSQSLLSREANIPTLIIFAHPKCPCSQATVGELERLVPRIHGKVKSLVVFFQPTSKPESWVKSALWSKSQSIPGVQTVLDVGGVMSAQFGAKTSGQTFLFDSNGNLVFDGGITPERGHMGDSAGRNAILQFVATGSVDVSHTSVFGCSLRNPERAIAGELDALKD